MRKPKTPDAAFQTLRQTFKSSSHTNAAAQSAYRQQQIAGEVPPSFKVIRYEEEFERDESSVLVPIVISEGTKGTFEACPNCFDLINGGGILIDHICSSCGFVLPFQETLFYKEKVKYNGPPRLNWNDCNYGGKSLLEIAVARRAKGVKLREIAEELSELTKTDIRPQNVSLHVGGGKSKNATKKHRNH